MLHLNWNQQWHAAAQGETVQNRLTHSWPFKGTGEETQLGLMERCGISHVGLKVYFSSDQVRIIPRTV